MNEKNRKMFKNDLFELSAQIVNMRRAKCLDGFYFLFRVSSNFDRLKWARSHHAYCFRLFNERYIKPNEMFAENVICTGTNVNNLKAIKKSMWMNFKDCDIRLEFRLKRIKWEPLLHLFSHFTLTESLLAMHDNSKQLRCLSCRKLFQRRP